MPARPYTELIVLVGTDFIYSEHRSNWKLTEAGTVVIDLGASWEEANMEPDSDILGDS